MRPTFKMCGVCLGGLLLAMSLTSSVTALEKWGPFRGQVVDVETGQPIAGAVVLVVWWEAVPTPVQTNQKFYDAREAVTDANGRFEAPRLSPPFFSFRIFDPKISYFAPGYEPIAEVVTPPEGQPFVAPTVVQMRRLQTRKEALELIGRAVPNVPWEKRFEKMPHYLRALNEERQRLGLTPYPDR